MRLDLGKELNMKKDSDYVLINTLYNRPSKCSDGKYHDCLSLVYKDINTGEKVLKQIVDCKVTGYMAKPNIEILRPRLTVPTNWVEPFTFTFKDREKELSLLLGGDYKTFYYDCIKNRKKRATKQVHKDKRLFATDVDVEDYYIYESYRHFGKKENVNLHKSYLDIEADIRLGSIDFKTGTGDAPVNAITFIDEKSMSSYTLLLRNYDNPLCLEFENHINEFIEELHNDFDDEFGKFDYKVLMYDREEDLIIDTFKIINMIKPDFTLIWNSSFDIRYMIHRLKELGYEPGDIMCHPDFYNKQCWYAADTHNFKLTQKAERFYLSSYTTFIDQMLNYASIRKSQAEYDNFKLDNIGYIEVGARKLDYSDTASLKQLPYINYWMFVKYNIKDVLVQFKIENKTKDIDLLFAKATDNVTRYHKIYKETVFLRNKAFVEFEEQGYILGNNQNIDYLSSFKKKEDEVSDSESSLEEKFEGALVGDPVLNNNTGIILLGRRSRNVYRNVMDYDYTSLYPTIIDMFNIFPGTQIGRIVSLNPPGPREITYDRYDRGGRIIDDLELDNSLNFGYTWLNLPSIEDNIKDFGEYMKSKNKDKFHVKVKDTKRYSIKIRSAS